MTQDGKCSKISNTFIFPFPKIANREDPDQTASEEKQSDLDLHCLSRHFGQATSVRNFRTFTIQFKYKYS